MSRKFFSLLGALIISGIQAQTPAEPIAQAAVPAAAVPSAQAAPAAGQAASAAAVLQALQKIKATNDELLNRQTATLQQLEEIEKAADQIRILTQRS